MNRPRILLDVDGPLTDGFWSAACAVLRELGVDACVDRIDRWDIMEAFGVQEHLAAEAYRRLRQPGLALSFAPNPGAREFVAGLQSWADVYAVTSPLGGPHWAHEREVWLWREAGIPASRVVSCRDKTVIVGDALLDDKPSTVRDWQAAYPGGIGILWRATHNEKEAWRSAAARGYEEALGYLGALRR